MEQKKENGRDIEAIREDFRAAIDAYMGGRARAKDAKVCIEDLYLRNRDIAQKALIPDVQEALGRVSRVEAEPTVFGEALWGICVCMIRKASNEKMARGLRLLAGLKHKELKKGSWLHEVANGYMARLWAEYLKKPVVGFEIKAVYPSEEKGLVLLKKPDWVEIPLSGESIKYGFEPSPN